MSPECALRLPREPRVHRRAALPAGPGGTPAGGPAAPAAAGRSSAALMFQSETAQLAVKLLAQALSLQRSINNLIDCAGGDGATSSN